MALILVLLLATPVLLSAQSCPCETSATQFTDTRFNCPKDNFCSDALVTGTCGKVCQTGGAFHSSPYDDTDAANVIGAHSCAGAAFDFDNGGSVLCSYATPSTVLSTSNACNVPALPCSGCDSSAIRYFDYDSDYFQVLCESGLIQYTYSDNTTAEYNYRLYLDKTTCRLSGGEDSSKDITAVSCKARPYEVNACLERAGSPTGLTGHCHFGTCWLYCADNSKQLSFQKELNGVGTRINADNLVCESTFVQYGQGSAFHLQCN